MRLVGTLAPPMAARGDISSFVIRHSSLAIGHWAGSPSPSEFRPGLSPVMGTIAIQAERYAGLVTFCCDASAATNQVCVWAGCKSGPFLFLLMAQSGGGAPDGWRRFEVWLCGSSASRHFLRDPLPAWLSVVLYFRPMRPRRESRKSLRGCIEPHRPKSSELSCFLLPSLERGDSTSVFAMTQARPRAAEGCRSTGR